MQTPRFGIAMPRLRRTLAALLPILFVLGASWEVSAGPSDRNPGEPMETTTTTAPPPTTTTTLSPEQQLAKEYAALHPTVKRILGCESSGKGPTGYPDWTAKNKKSSASGGMQALDGTWRSWAKNYARDWIADAANYRRAFHAPPLTQLRMTDRVFMHEGTGPWYASKGCWR